MTRGEKVIAFVERYCKVPEGAKVGKPLVLEPFQKEFLLAVYDNPDITKEAILSIARKNGKTALIASIVLAHVCGPEAKLNSQVVSGAMSRDQAALVFNLASKMVQLSPELSEVCRIVPSQKKIIGIRKNVEYKALAAEGKTQHGLSPIVAILDEVGQVRGPNSEFVDAIVTSQGAHENPLLFVISTQAPNDADLLSVWIDDAVQSKDSRIVCHVYSADKEEDLLNEDSWKKANPALGTFRSLEDVKAQAEKAQRMPSFEPTFRNLVLNQRVELISPFISKGIWLLNSQEVNNAAFYESPVYIGLDLSAKTDLTAMVLVALHEGKYHVKPVFWTPLKGLKDRAKTDRAPYDIWVDQGYIRAVDGASINYEQVCIDIAETLEGMNIVGAGFDRWRFDLLKAEFDKINLELPLIPFGQGFKDMAPAIDALESALLNEKLSHGGHPVLTMCMANARVEKDAAGNRKLNKFKATGRIDGAVALAMAVGLSERATDENSNFDGFISNPLAIR
jgi:phage terminase large subunit-like protein